MRGLLERCRGVRHLPLLALILIFGIVALLFLNTSTPKMRQVEGTPLEVRVASVLSAIEGAGDVRILIREGDEVGALIVAEGASSVRVVLALQRAAKALLGIPVERIEVLPMEPSSAVERGG